MFGTPVGTKFERYLTLIPNNSQKKRFRKSCNIHEDIPNNMTKMESVQHLCQSGELCKRQMDEEKPLNSLDVYSAQVTRKMGFLQGNVVLY